MLLDNSFSSDTRVEKEIKTLQLNLTSEITVFAIQDNSLSVTEKRNNYTIKRILPEILKSPLKSGYKKALADIAEHIEKENFDIIHCHDYHMLFIGKLIKKRKNDIKLIYDAHEYLRGWPFYLTNKGIINKLKGYLVWRKELYLEKKSIKFCDEILTVTTTIARSFQKDYNLSNLPEVISNYPTKVDIKRSNFIKEKIGLDDNKKIIIHSGSIYFSEEQINKLITKIDENKNTVIVFVGNRPQFYELKNRFTKNQTYHKLIYFIEYPKNHEILFKILSSADIGLVHIRNKWKAHKFGLANKFVEYSHAGLAVISTYQDSIYEINKMFDHCKFYNENDINEFELALKDALNNLEIMKNNALKTRDHLTWESEGERLVKLYKNIMD